MANYGTASQMEKLVRKYEKVEKNQQRPQQQDHQQLRELTWRQDDNGMAIDSLVQSKQRKPVFDVYANV